MTTKMKFAAMLLVAFGMAGLSSVSAFARGGAPSIMDSPGYQRRLQESRQAYTTPPAVYPGRKWRHRRHHYH